MNEDWFKQSVRHGGMVYFRGTITPRPQELSFLERHGVTLSTAESKNPAQRWELRAEHPKWGEATIVGIAHVEQPPRMIVDFDPSLTPDERREIASGQSGVGIFLTPNSAQGDARDDPNLLRDRKRLLRYLNAVLGDDGVAAVDISAQRFWTSAQLADELSHDADLDIESILTVHAVTNEDRCYWIHTHGLDSIGAVDFDILDPAREYGQFDAIRALAFMIAERKIDVHTPEVQLMWPGPTVRLVDVKEFNRRGAADARKFRDTDGHDTNRAVVCDPAPAGWLRRKFHRWQPAALFRRPLPDGTIIGFTNGASRLMADRARRTYDVFRAIMDEMADMKFGALVKIAYVVDFPQQPGEVEALWFHVQKALPDSVDATLINKPYNIARMQEGQRSVHSLDGLYDWAIYTPVGTITPRNFAPLRYVRADRESIRKKMEEFRRTQPLD